MAKLTKADKKGLNLSPAPKPTVIIPFAPTMPDVNLLPPRVFDAVAARKARHRLAITGGALVLAVVGAYVGQTAQIMVANTALKAELSKSAALQKQVTTLTPIKVFYAGVATQKASLQKTMAHELYFSEVATELSKSRPAGVTVDTLTAAVSEADATTGASASASGCPAQNPFTPATIVTCVQFTGTSPKRENVAVFIQNLLNNPKFANVYIPVTDSGEDKPLTFTGSVGITEKFYSRRYADDAYLLKGVGAK